MYKIIRKNEMENAITLVGEKINQTDLNELIYEIKLNKDIIVRPSEQFTPPFTFNPASNRSKRSQSETLTKVQEYELDDGSKVSLTFYASITPVDATISTLQMQLFIITGIMVALATILAIVISKRIAKPIEQINARTKLLTEGNYEADFQGHGFLEIKELSDTLNVAASELSKVEDFRKELMANVSHDLRTPLALIYSYAEMMHDFPDEVTPQQTEVIMDETKRLTSLVNDVLDISTLERGESELKKAPFNLTESLESTIIRMRELVKKEGYGLQFDYDEKVEIYADESKIIQVFYNLLLNAITHSSNEQAVKIRQITIKDTVRIEVIDYGEGIKKSDLPYIWDRYYKKTQSHTRTIIGTGLGLSIVKKIINLHGGQYGVESEIGKGSMFWFSLNIND
ncbi:sensor histidine kinase [Carnobacterium funditum]|uniref:sensor histidine kinase n=1 Tax=Carnobacterium funditum TaxID=2752 RepID=UPI000B1407DF|nr:HAMP domain-containing sensor histidine kinase [Carnobacterium funditum]